jgi:hypothetical protein
MADTNWGGKLGSLLQGASNSAASTVTAPIDALSWLLRKGGLQIDNPIGGSDWARQQGLTAEPRDQTMGTIGEALSGVVPIFASAKAPQIARGLLQMGENALAPATNNRQLGAVVYHGSPHKFDAFDASKIGTGEGAQAYGHGLYFAESPDVAKSYRDVLAGADKRFELGGRVVDPRMMDSFESNALQALAYGQTPKQALANYEAQGVSDSALKRLATILDDFSAKGVKVQEIPKGDASLYKVDLPDNAIAKMLDWDKPLSQQPVNVQSYLAKSNPDMYHPTGGDYDAMEMGQQIYRRLHEDAIRTGKALPAKEKELQVVNQLRQAGIPGIRYLDQGSRGAGTGTSNYVVFPQNEGLLKILERNGKPLP